MDIIENEKIRGDAQTRKQQGDLISLLTKIRKIRGDTQTDSKVTS
jgi:hypothetical protein